MVWTFSPTRFPLHDQKGAPHHLLGTVSPNVEFTAKDFRDSAIPLINDILSCNCLPVIFEGTNYYIQDMIAPSHPNILFNPDTLTYWALVVMSQSRLCVKCLLWALVSPFLLNDTVENVEERFLGDHPGAGQQQTELAYEVDNSSYSYDDLKVIDPIAAN